MTIPSKLRDIDVESNYRWIKGIYETMNKIDKYQAIADDEQNPEDMRKAFAKEVEFQKRDLEDCKELIRGFKSSFSQLLFKKYIEGYTLEEVAVDMGYVANSLDNVHAQFTRALREKGLAI
ncbi:hypothetical protein ACIQYS_14455 [Psychrobacillus sp. NPDC096426]|uniref:hypothetical protein n=1 Tax=Psychrobacillus sp. NPDC096426 TaxID=3364491 RepID=UPI0037FEB827